MLPTKTFFIIIALFAATPLFAEQPTELYLEYNLFEAIGEDDYAYVKELLERDLDVNKTHPPFDQTPLIIAPNHGMKYVALLMAHGADVNAKDDDHNTALINASFLGKADIVQYLLNNGADVFAVNKDGITPLEAAKIYKSPETIRLIEAHIKSLNQEKQRLH